MSRLTKRTTWILVAAAVVGALVLAGRRTNPSSSAGPAAGLPAPRHAPSPADVGPCRKVHSSQDLQAAIETAPDGGALCLEPGQFEGTFRIERPMTISGPPEAVVKNPGHGSTFFIASDRVRLHGFTILGSGDRYVKQDAGIFVSESDHVRLESLLLRDVLFGITAQKVDDLVVRNTDITCRSKAALGMRGDGVRLWETRRSVISGNHLQDCRDLVVWYSPDNLIEKNRVEGGRYGTHFMYSSRNLVRQNAYVDNVVGIFVMYSRNLRLDSNILADASGAAGVGLGLKESGNLEITRNHFIHNTVGAYVDTSPLHRDDSNLFAFNEFRLGNTGLTFHSSPHRNAFVANTVQDNARPVVVEGGGDATQVQWTHNYYDTYAGYDLDDDAVGDIPFELRSASDQLVGRYPNLELLTGTPAMFLVEAATRMAPMYQPKLLLSDPRPLMEPAGQSPAAPDFAALLAERGLVEVTEEDGRVRVDSRTDGAQDRRPQY